MIQLPDSRQFHPFYEWLPDQFPIPFIVKLFISVLLGFAFLVSHYLVVGARILDDWSWLLGLVIVTAMLCLYYATHSFRAMFPHMRLRLEATGGSSPESIYLNPTHEYLSNRQFIITGALFAFLNCGVGWILGVSDQQSAAVATTYLGFFIAGFVCGMPVAGIRGVVIVLTRFMDEGRPLVDYTNPDGCGGFLFFGEALIKFSAVTLIVGVLMSVYILEVQWMHTSQASPLVQALMWLWITLPFLLSLTILLAPASRANKALMNHKIEKEVEIAMAFHAARNALRDAGSDSTLQERLRKDIEFHTNQRVQLHRMRSWPFDAQTNIKFLLLFVSNAWVAIESIRGMLGGPSVVPGGW